LRQNAEPAASAFSVGVAVFTIFSFEIGAAFTKGLREKPLPAGNAAE
jgi:hypothetical protein